MKKSIAFALAMVLTSAIQAAPPSKTASTTGKTLSNVVPAAQAENPTAAPAQTNTGNGSGSNMVCPPGVKPQNAANSKCLPRPTKTIQR